MVSSRHDHGPPSSANRTGDGNRRWYLDPGLMDLGHGSSGTSCKDNYSDNNSNTSNNNDNNSSRSCKCSGIVHVPRRMQPTRSGAKRGRT